MSDGRAVHSEDVGEILRTTPPPAGFEPFAVALGSVAAAPSHVFGQALDPFRPADIVNAPGSSTGAPPHCPLCHSLIQPIVQNKDGDTLFECLFDGYETVYRVKTNVWEPRPQREVDNWRPPVFGESPATATPGPVAAPADPVSVPVFAPVSVPAVVIETVSTSPPVAAPVPAPTVRQPMAPRRSEPTSSEWLTLGDAAAVLGVPAAKVYALVQGGVASRRGPDQSLLVNLTELQKTEASGG